MDTMNLHNEFNKSLRTPLEAQRDEVPQRPAAAMDAGHGQGAGPGWPQDKPLFTPPLYKQRYEAIVQLVKKYRPRRMADFGCSECKLLQKIKWEPYVEELAGVDIDRGVLIHNSHTLKPLPCDYLIPRDNRLTVRLYHGSVADRDPSLRGYDFVSCVELIEHLDPEVLAALPGVLLGYVSPQVAVITTPNVEFNVLLPGLKGLRHWDHRFEWTRGQFQAWCTDVARTYGYSVYFSGVGQAPPGHHHLGFCSQMAIFEKANPWLESLHHTVKDTGGRYELVFEFVFPTLQDKHCRDAMLLFEVQFLVDGSVRRYQEERDDFCGANATPAGGSPTFPSPPTSCSASPNSDSGAFARRSSSGYKTQSDGAVSRLARGWPPARQTAIKAASNGTEVVIDLAMIYISDKVQKLCSSVEHLREVIKSGSNFQLSHDETAIVCHLPENQELNWGRRYS